jgi:hypothetical protein
MIAPQFIRWPLAFGLLGFLTFASVSLGDTVQLANGDLVSGQVVSLDAKTLVLKSELLGDVKIDRTKIAAILLGDRPAPSARPGPARTSPAAQSTAPAPAQGAAAPKTVDEILKQIQGSGINPKMTKGLEGEFPLLATPEVRQYFDKTLGGLVSGDLSVSDLRQQAIDVRNQVKDLEKELGPEATQALSGYMSILDKFIRESGPKKPAGKPAK